MATILFTALARDLIAAFTGIVIGAAFGLLQLRALRRNERLRNESRLGSHWRVMGGSPKRVVWFLLCLVAIQVLCPALFVQGAQWWVSGGVALGYGLIQFQQFRRARQFTG